MKLYTLYFFTFFHFSLQSQPNSQDSLVQHSGFAFYLLRDSTIATYKIFKVPLDSLALASEPLFTAQDIKTYSWSTHIFTLNPKVDSVFAPLCTLGRKSRDIPFVIKVGNERIYLGEFYSPYSSLLPPCAYIFISSSSPYKINYTKFASHPDKRSDNRIHNALQAASVLIE
jgi:hypothetical protein